MVYILCLPLGVVVSFSSSKVSNTGEMVPSALLTQIIALSFLLLLLLLPKDLTASLQSQFKCSLWRSAGIFHPLHPRTFTNRPCILWAARCGGRT